MRKIARAPGRDNCTGISRIDWIRQEVIRRVERDEAFRVTGVLKDVRRILDSHYFVHGCVKNQECLVEAADSFGGILALELV